MASDRLVTEVRIGVSPPAGDAETSFADLALRHAGCLSNGLKRFRNPATDIYSLTCACGLSLTFPSLGTTVAAIQRTAIDGRTRTLPEGSYSSSDASPVLIELTEP
jgi:hypothetical protein